MAAVEEGTRRERIRSMTLAEIREHAFRQIAEGGVEGLSLNGIAKAMGMSGPSMYRYFSSRDDLLASLVTESYEDLAEALRVAAGEARARKPERRLRAVLEAPRKWALGSPSRYRLVFQSTYGSGALEPDRIVPASQRAMDVILAAFADVAPEGAGKDPTPPINRNLARQLGDWAQDAGESSVDLGAKALGLTAWTRLHGIISLEIDGAFAEMKIDAALLYDSEIDHLIAQRQAQAIVGA